MTPRAEAPRQLRRRRFARRGFPAAEIFEKSGRSRRFVRKRGVDSARGSADVPAAGDDPGDGHRGGLGAARRRSPAVALLRRHRQRGPGPRAAGAEPASAAPARPGDWRAAGRAAVRRGARAAGRASAEDFDTPLATESVAATLLSAIERELRRELPGSRLRQAWLEDGAAEWTLLSTTGLRAESRARAAFLRLEVEDHGRRCLFEGAEREARRFEPRALALRLVDRLCALEEHGERSTAAASRPICRCSLRRRSRRGWSRPSRRSFSGRRRATACAPLGALRRP